MGNSRQSPGKRESFTPKGVEEKTAAFLKIRGGRRAPTSDPDAFSRKLALTRPFVAEPTD
jgi:hypothetical protein